MVNRKWLMVNSIKALKGRRLSGVKTRGDTILEVVVATAILSTILIATFNILQRAVDTNVNISNRIIALNIAREGIEAVRNIRDTNWLKYSGDRRDKWLCHDSSGNPDNCDGSNFSGDGDLINGNDDANDTYYIVDFDTSVNRYYLTETTQQAEIDFLASQPNREQFRLYLTGSAPQRYTHTSTGNTATEFYRQIYLDIDNPYNTTVVGLPPTFCDGTPSSEESCTKARLKVVSRVYWQEEGRQRVTTLETHLFDFFERDDY